jgi:hypothetical protein
MSDVRLLIVCSTSSSLGFQPDLNAEGMSDRRDRRRVGGLPVLNTRNRRLANASMSGQLLLRPPTQDTKIPNTFTQTVEGISHDARSVPNSRKRSNMECSTAWRRASTSLRNGTTDERSE